MPVRVMVVDDSAVVRGLISKTLQQDGEIEVVASASNGRMALLELDKHDIDVVILDIEMPVMDGMTALPQLLEKKPNLKVIMASTLTLRNADISLEALRNGAADYITKPSTSEGPQAAVAFREALRDKVKAYGAASPTSLAPEKPFQSRSPSAPPSCRRAPLRVSASQGKLSLRPEPSGLISALAIASSTGGPQALFRLMEDLKNSLTRIPVFITQHMPPTFTKMLASHIEKISPLSCSEAESGEMVAPGKIYIAPGGYHMLIEQKETGKQISLTTDEPVNFCRPSADPMIESLAAIYGPRLAVIVLTGMGSDGLNGCRAAVGKGATVLAQDEATSVVWGMPGAVAQDGICSAVLPIDRLGPHIRNRLPKD